MIQCVKLPNEPPCDLTEFGKISEMNTQITAPWEKAKKAGLPVAPDVDSFYRDFEFMGMQRHLKILGIFARLAHRDGKPHYLDDLPTVLEYVRKTANRYRELVPLLRLLESLENNAPQFGYTF